MPRALGTNCFFYSRKARLDTVIILYKNTFSEKKKTWNSCFLVRDVPQLDVAKPQPALPNGRVGGHGPQVRSARGDTRACGRRGSSKCRASDEPTEEAEGIGHKNSAVFLQTTWGCTNESRANKTKKAASVHEFSDGRGSI